MDLANSPDIGGLVDILLCLASVVYRFCSESKENSINILVKVYEANPLSKETYSEIELHTALDLNYLLKKLTLFVRCHVVMK